MSLNPTHLRLYVIRPTLQRLALWSPAAEDLLLGTAAAESGLRALDQITGPGDVVLGPAYGLFQMEEATHDDLWRNVINYNPPLRARVEDFMGTFPTPVTQLVTNLAYATVMARLVYWRRPAPLPERGDVAGYAAYWKRHYNTPLGKGTEEHFRQAYTALGCGFA